MITQSVTAHRKTNIPSTMWKRPSGVYSRPSFFLRSSPIATNSMETTPIAIFVMVLGVTDLYSQKNRSPTRKPIIISAKNRNGRNPIRFLLISLMITAISSTTIIRIPTGMSISVKTIPLQPSANGLTPSDSARKFGGRYCAFSSKSVASSTTVLSCDSLSPVL